MELKLNKISFLSNSVKAFFLIKNNRYSNVIVVKIL